MEKTIALTRWMFVGKVMSLLLNMLSRLVISFPPRSKCLQNPPSTVLSPGTGAEGLEEFVVRIPGFFACPSALLETLYFSL